jgi:hypothetical protein
MGCDGDFRRLLEEALSVEDDGISLMLSVGRAICELIDFESRSAFYSFPSSPGARLVVQSRGVEGVEQLP